MIYDRVLDELGAAVVHGGFGTAPVSIDDLVARTGASRSIVREAVRVLVGLGLLRARRRVGVLALAPSEWDVLDPRVIGWRLSGPDLRAVLDELRALRRAVEPAAAAAAAAADGDAAGLEALLASADHLATAAGAADATAFLQADRALHRAVLDRSGNTLFRRLHGVVERALDERAGIGPDEHDVRLHGALARAVADGDPAAARATMQEIVDRT
ncbi:DNA-binding FadR family transcriptional regulator [Curtobacterium luteum]|uniref:DNA-binding FadR family transcriptional regulator n=1 Tax=Curtobacterium luteum TaxID=33881 RepID=A0A8H9G9K0_9MICO|nr:FCD domain-containing protein [Curtobacterium luteum]MBM7803606.1 DNA-binding FadR family transcriptional regulator [Curtobacterium luteum]NUU50123.1 FadR family transcriptional regulator [Curtobacterium luteum]GGK99296.1 GntR family transcriptional regulator [Curtobacterium luteum]